MNQQCRQVILIILKDNLSDRAELVRNHSSDLISYSTLQPNLQYFDTSYGYIAYRKIGKHSITLGPPVCQKSDMPSLTQRFLAKNKSVSFCYLNENSLDDMRQAGLRVSAIGVDRMVNYDRFFQNTDKKVISAVHKASKENLIIKEVSIGEINSELISTLAKINDDFLLRSVFPGEMIFLNKPMDYSDDHLRRVFTLSVQNSDCNDVIGFLTLNPIFNNGKVDGYLLDIIRFKKTKLWGLWYASVWNLSKLLEREGKFLSLGFCPLVTDIAQSDVKTSLLLDGQMAILKKLFLNIKYFQQLYNMKCVIGGEFSLRYIATTAIFLPPVVSAFLNATGGNFKSLLFSSRRR